jgi:hypothetical protein
MYVYYGKYILRHIPNFEEGGNWFSDAIGEMVLIALTMLHNIKPGDIH